MRRWSLPGRAPSASAAAAATINEDIADADGDVEVVTRVEVPLVRRATLAANPRRDDRARTEDEWAALFAELNEAFGVDFSQTLGAMVFDAETATVATTCTDPSCCESRREGGDGDEPERGGGSGGVPPGDQSGVATLPVDTPVPVARHNEDLEDAELRWDDCWQMVAFVLILVIVMVAIVFILLILL